jgi:hypothetical protein
LRSFISRFNQDVSRIIRGIEIENARLKTVPNHRGRKGEVASASTAAQARLVFIRFLHYLCSGDPSGIMPGSIEQLLKDAQHEQRRLNNGMRKQALYLRALDQQSEIKQTFELLLLLKKAFVELSIFFGEVLLFLERKLEIGMAALENAENSLFGSECFRSFVHEAAMVALVFSCNGQRLQVNNNTYNLRPEKNVSNFPVVQIS